MDLRDKLLFYWKATEKELVWNIAFRKRINNSTLINDLKTPFEIYELKNGFWGADPLPIETKNGLFLFFELYDKKRSKGVIACSELIGDTFSEPRIVLDAEYHLSFPFVFSHDGKYFMIPETGSNNTIELYECDNFPYEWSRKAVLEKNIHSSDTIVIKRKKDLYVIASVLRGNNACDAVNSIYELNIEKNKLHKLYFSKENGCHGIRNAGPFFQTNDCLYRPGQNCDGLIYGKSLIIFQVLKFDSDDYVEEEKICVEPDSIVVKGYDGKFEGIHTYSVMQDYEFIDLKKTQYNSIWQRTKKMKSFLWPILKSKLKK